MMIAVRGRAKPVNWPPNWEIVSEVQSLRKLVYNSRNPSEKVGIIPRSSISVVDEDDRFSFELVAAVDPGLMSAISF